MATRFVRQDIWKLEQEQPNHPVTRAYASAIAVMRDLPRENPTSLLYQAAVHGSSVTDKFLNQCQHATWFFLSWHRLYLLYFEQIVRKIIQGLDDVDDQTKETWALPYWDSWDPRPPGATESGANPFVDRLPLPFRKPADATNPLFVTERSRAIKAGGRIDSGITRPHLALQEDRFSRDMIGAPPGFGGPPVGLHHGGGTFGALEGTPHNGVHGAVGGRPPEPAGFMSRQSTAGRDPIFYLHHANIDRLWDIWLRQGGGRENPTTSDWLGQEFHFHNGDGNEVTKTARDFEDLIDYGYADLSPPVPPARPLEAPPMERRAEPDHPAELVGATDGPMELAGRAETARFGVSRPAGPLRAAGAEPSRVYLNVEGIRGEENPGLSYAVFVNAPDQDDTTDDAHYAGNINFFGIENAEDLDQDHPGGHGALRFAFDITDIYTRLRDAGVWDEAAITVTFRPIGVLPPPGAEPASAEPEETPPVTIGRVSVFYH